MERSRRQAPRQSKVSSKRSERFFRTSRRRKEPRKEEHLMLKWPTRRRASSTSSTPLPPDSAPSSMQSTKRKEPDMPGALPIGTIMGIITAIDTALPVIKRVAEEALPVMQQAAKALDTAVPG